MNYKNNWLYKKSDTIVLVSGISLLIASFLASTGELSLYCWYCGILFWVFGLIVTVGGLTLFFIITPFNKLTTDSRMSGSIWHKPAVYWAIVAIFLLVTDVMGIFYISYHEYKNPPPNYGLSALHYPAIVMLLSFFVIPSIMGGFLLLQKRKNGFVPALISLALFDIPFLALAFEQYNHWSFLGRPMFILDSIMIAFLIIGWKKMFGKSLRSIREK